jgi:hypothetical protein
MLWVLKHPRMTAEHLGLLPSLLSDTDPRPVKEQIESNYSYGGGWQPLAGFTINKQGLCFPGDPPMRLLAESRLRDERLLFFECDWLAVVQPDGSFQVSRMD